MNQQPEIIRFGPCRIIGVRYEGKNEQGEIVKLWDEQLLPRIDEIGRPAEPGGSFGLCRCLPDATDGSFEYIAAVQASSAAPVPRGMVEAAVPEGEFAVFKVPSVAVVQEAWSDAMEWVLASDRWAAYCVPGNCDCATRASFEYYPPDFGGEGSFYIYVPVRTK